MMPMLLLQQQQSKLEQYLYELPLLFCSRPFNRNIWLIIISLPLDVTQLLVISPSTGFRNNAHWQQNSIEYFG